MLACRLCSSDLNTKPITLKWGRDSYTTKPSKILKMFSERLESIYSASAGFDKDRADALFSSIELPSMPPSLKESPEECNVGEVAYAIKLVKIHKRPGPDGFSADFYKKFSNLLTPMLMSAFNAILAHK